MPPKSLIAATLALLLFGVADARASTSSELADRARLTEAVVQKWSGYVDRTYKISGKTWAREMAPAFAEASLEELEAAAKSQDFQSVSRLLLGQETLTPEGEISIPKLLGDAARDLVFVPIPPCRIFDTRLAGGQIAANAVRSFDINAVSNYSSQGGSADNCSGAGADGSFAAAVINFTVVTPNAAGYITAYPLGTPRPVAATVNYSAGAIVGNTAIVALDQGASANELSVYSFAQTHLVGDLTGYFITPQATRLDCTPLTSGGQLLAPGTSLQVLTPACPVGYDIFAGGCSADSENAVLYRSFPFIYDNELTQRYGCGFRNEGATTTVVAATARCCRIPGR